MFFQKANPIKTLETLEGLYIMTADGCFGRVEMDGSDSIKVSNPLFSSGGSVSLEVDYLNDVDYIIMTETEAKELLAPLFERIKQPVAV